MRLAALLLTLPILIALTPRCLYAQSEDVESIDLSTERLEAFFNERVPALLEDYRVPGAVVSVVANGAPLLVSGYGHAAFEPDQLATGDTPFATGSVAKLFTWTAVMQLVERGELDLDADINIYLDFEIPAGFAQPVTLRHLLGHTPGFEDYPMIGLFSRDADNLPNLGDIVSSSIPARIWPPGIEIAYSNFGSGLAGYVVERVSGVPFAKYIEINILEPLGMSRSSFRQPLPANLADDAAIGHLPDGDDSFVAGGAEFVPMAPAGGMVMSAADAARFMLAHLQGGSFDGARILAPETTAQMHSTLFRDHPSMPGNAHGFWESARHGERILQHPGDTQLFHTQLAILPDRGVGFYIATNAVGGTKMREALWEAFLDHFYPVPPPSAVDVSAAELSSYSGLYRINRASTTSMAKVAGLFQLLRVRSETGHLVAEFIDMERRLLPLGNGLFADADREGELVLFQRDGNRTIAYVSEFPMMVFRNLKLIESPAFHGLLLLLIGVVELSGLVGFPLLAWLARRRRHIDNAWARGTRVVGFTAALLPLIFGILFMVAMADPMGPAFGVTPLLAAALGVGLVIMLAIAIFALLIVFAWVHKWWHPVVRVHATIVAFAGLSLLWQLDYWNLLGFKF